MSYLAKNYNRKKISFKHGRGSYLYSIDNKKYLDFVQGIAVNSLGHAHPKLIKTIKDQSKKLWHVSNAFQIPEGEKLAGVNSITPSGQYVHTLINKGKIFRGCIEQDPSCVQAGLLIESFLNETLGKGWICHSFLANGAEKGYYPQVLHLDQSPLSPWITEEAPALVNTLYIPQDVNEVNGGTLIIPGSHKNIIQAGSNGEVGKLPPAINLEAKAGTVMLFDGRLLHGTGVNHTDEIRFVAAMSNVKSWMRSQENWIISVDPKIIESASPSSYIEWECKLQHMVEQLKVLEWVHQEKLMKYTEAQNILEKHLIQEIT